MLSLVIPKGSLERATLELFDAADLTVRRSSDRDYHATIDDPRIERVRFLRPQEIPVYVEEGLFDFGITGRDWITETGADVRRWASCSTPRPPPTRSGWCWRCRPRCLAEVEDLPDGIRISTELPALTRRFLEARGVKAVVIRPTAPPRPRCPTSWTRSST